MLPCERLPTFPDSTAGLRNTVPRFLPLHDFQCFQGSRGTDPLRPECAADKSALGSFHNAALSYGGGNGIAVTQCLSEHGHVGFHAIQLVQSAERLPKT